MECVAAYKARAGCADEAPPCTSCRGDEAGARARRRVASETRPSEAPQIGAPSWLQMRSGRGRATTGCMIDVVRFAFWLVADVVRRRAELVAENALLRQQLIAAQRKIRGRVRWTPWERFTLGLAARLAPAFRVSKRTVESASNRCRHSRAAVTAFASQRWRRRFRTNDCYRVKRRWGRYPPWRGVTGPKGKRGLGVYPGCKRLGISSKTRFPPRGEHVARSVAGTIAVHSAPCPIPFGSRRDFRVVAGPQRHDPHCRRPYFHGLPLVSAVLLLC